MKRTLHIALLSFFMIGFAVPAVADQPEVQRLRAVLNSPGGELPFGLELVRESAGGAVTRAVVINGVERIEIDDVSTRDEKLVIRIGHYNSVIAAETPDRGKTWRGTWTKTGRSDRLTRLPFIATADPGHRFQPLSHGVDSTELVDVVGRWRVQFAQDSAPAVGVFTRAEDGAIHGTFLTPGGDYRYLAGSWDAGRLRLSCFDGSHAFLFDARMQSDGTLAGDFWSGDSWHDTWTAQRDAEAALPDGFSDIATVGVANFAALKFPNIDGAERSLAVVLGGNRAMVLEVFGSWCPNCHDASRLLDELRGEYAPRGLAVVGLAFEYTGVLKRDAPQLRKYLAHCGVQYPVLYGGPAERGEVVRKLPFLKELRAYPTTIFLRADGRVAAIHTGFSGPATGSAYDDLRAAFKRIIEEMLAEQPPPTAKP